VIDAAYISRVLTGLDAAIGDVVRTVVAGRSLTPEVNDRMKALFGGDAFTSQMNLLIEGTAKGFPGVKPNPGDRKTTVVKLVSARSDCAFVRVVRDYTAVSLTPLPEATNQYVGVRTLDIQRDPDHLNPTGWTIVYEGYRQDGSQPPDPCGSS